jgi:hypothetical protein
MPSGNKNAGGVVRPAEGVGGAFDHRVRARARGLALRSLGGQPVREDACNVTSDPLVGPLRRACVLRTAPSSCAGSKAR